MIPNDLGAWVEALAAAMEPRLVAIRRDLHAHPELAFEEVRTAALVSGELARLGIAHRTGVGRTGVLGEIDTGRPGPTLLLRADMDALPITERTGLPFASTRSGVMHACGHDLHTATLIGVAEVLAELAPHLAGRIRLMFQPAEETPDSGAEAMIGEGALHGVDLALGFHNYPQDEVGAFTFVPGIAGGSADEFEIALDGRAGHAARPHLARDPIVAAATLVLQLQTVVSREIDPMHPVVVTVGAIEGGATHNVIPGRARIIGTVRAREEGDRDAAEAAIRRLCEGVTVGMRVRCDLAMLRGVPATRTDDRVLRPVLAAIREHFGEGAVREGRNGLGAEDFALIAERVPAFQLGIGSATPGRADELHNDDYRPDERSLKLGVVALSLAAIRLLQGA